MREEMQRNVLACTSCVVQGESESIQGHDSIPLPANDLRIRFF